MLVNHTYRFLFVHIPKTSGAAFRAYNRKRLSSWWRKDSEEICAAHAALTPEVAERFKDYFKFIIVRDPWQLIASAYRFDTQGIRRNKQGALKQRDIPLVEWLEEKGKDTRFGPFPYQIRYVSFDGQLLIDRICRQDRLAFDMKENTRPIGCTIPRGRLGETHEALFRILRLEGLLLGSGGEKDGRGNVQGGFRILRLAVAFRRKPMKRPPQA